MAAECWRNGEFFQSYELSNSLIKDKNHAISSRACHIAAVALEYWLDLKMQQNAQIVYVLHTVDSVLY